MRLGRKKLTAIEIPAQIGYARIPDLEAQLARIANALEILARGGHANLTVDLSDPNATLGHLIKDD